MQQTHQAGSEFGLKAIAWGVSVAADPEAPAANSVRLSHGSHPRQGPGARPGRMTLELADISSVGRQHIGSRPGVERARTSLGRPFSLCGRRVLACEVLVTLHI